MRKIFKITALAMCAVICMACGRKDEAPAVTETVSQEQVPQVTASVDKSVMTILQTVNSHAGQTTAQAAESEEPVSSAPEGAEVIDLGNTSWYETETTTPVTGSDVSLNSSDRLDQLRELYERHNFNEFDIHLMAVGDDLMHTGVTETGHQADGTYNYDALYTDIAPYLAIADIKVINQETIFGGDDKEFTSYPTFNSPTAMGDSIVRAGFNVVLQATNHICDMGISGINYAYDYWKTSHPETLVIGIYGEEGKSEDIPILEIDGVKFAMLNYTYGANWESLQSNLEYHTEMLTSWDPSSRKIDFNSLNPDVIDDIQRAEEIADVVVVFPHWGIEYQTTENSYQDWVAKAMVEAGADLIVGTHPHVPQPVKWIEADNGNRGLCYFSLGNYLSTQYYPDTLLEAMAWVTFHVGYDGIEIVEEDTGVLPMVLQYHTGPLRIDGVVAVENYTDELAAAHGAPNRGGSYCGPDHFKTRSSEIFGDEWILTIDEILAQGN